jgi:uncharacterized membrane protein
MITSKRKRNIKNQIIKFHAYDIPVLLSWIWYIYLSCIRIQKFVAQGELGLKMYIVFLVLKIRIEMLLNATFLCSFLLISLAGSYDWNIFLWPLKTFELVNIEVQTTGSNVLLLLSLLLSKQHIVYYNLWINTGIHKCLQLFVFQKCIHLSNVHQFLL